MKLLCTKGNGWTTQDTIYDVVKEDEYGLWIKVPLPRRPNQYELAAVCLPELKFYCGIPFGIAEFEVAEEMTA